MVTLIWLCIISNCFQAITQDCVSVSESCGLKILKYLLYYMTSLRKVSWPQYWRIKCTCELTQIIVVVSYYFKNAEMSLHILVDMTKYIDTYIYIIDCTLPRWVYHISKWMFPRGMKSFTWLCFLWNPDFVILNFIHCSEYVFFNSLN